MELKLLALIFSMQSNFLADSLSLELVNKELHIKSDETLIYFEVKMRNNSKENLLLYNFKSEPEQAFGEESFFCNNRMSARSTIVIYDEEFNQIYASIPPIPSEINYKPISSPKFQKVISEEKSNFRNAVQFMNRGEEINFPKRANIEAFQLNRGTYFIKLLYTSGTSTKNMLTREGIEMDRQKYKAKIFSGCVKSSFLKLIME